MTTNQCKCGGEPFLVTHEENGKFFCHIQCDGCGVHTDFFEGDCKNQRLVMKETVDEWNSLFGA